ncbi:MAG: hypothetical protein AAF943_10655 [Pseudomonadota bacterium]
MSFELRVALYAAATGGTVITGAFMMPPLTSGESAPLVGIASEGFEEAQSAEFSFCRRANVPADCACFARRAGIIISNETPRVPGMIYPSKEQLARDQALIAC